MGIVDVPSEPDMAGKLGNLVPVVNGHQFVQK